MRRNFRTNLDVSEKLPKFSLLERNAHCFLQWLNLPRSRSGKVDVHVAKRAIMRALNTIPRDIPHVEIGDPEATHGDYYFRVGYTSDMMREDLQRFANMVNRSRVDYIVWEVR